MSKSEEVIILTLKSDFESRKEGSTEAPVGPCEPVGP